VLGGGGTWLPLETNTQDTQPRKIKKRPDENLRNSMFEEL
jgi:hypothetical protein